MRLFVLVLLLPPTVNGVQTVAQNQQPPAVNQAYDAGHDSLYRWYLRATIIGVGVALLGIGAIYGQTRATAKAAKATEASVKLQAIALRQWMNLQHWEVWMEKKTSTMRIRFALVNPTTLPLEVNSISITAVILRLTNKAGCSDTSDELEVLPPNNPLILDASVPLSEEQVSELIALEDKLAIDIFVKCAVTFTDSSSRGWYQTFERAVFFDKGTFFALAEYKLLEPSVRDLKNHLKEQKVN
jgi:hypothetical protein